MNYALKIVVSSGEGGAGGDGASRTFGACSRLRWSAAMRVYGGKSIWSNRRACRSTASDGVYCICAMNAGVALRSEDELRHMDGDATGFSLIGPSPHSPRDLHPYLPIFP